MTGARPRVAVVIVSYRDYAARYLAACYRSLESQDRPRGGWGLWIVDSDSTDESAAALRRLAPGARIVRSRAHVGWAGGNNLGIREALSGGAEQVLLLNMDTVMEPGCLRAIASAADARPDCHILQAKLLRHGSRLVNSLGNRIHYLGYGYCQGNGQRDDGRMAGDRVDFASGAAMLVKREVFDAVGLFEDAYQLYYDDQEFSWRARLAGLNVGVAPEAVVLHHYAPPRRERLYYFQRNRLLTLLAMPRVRTLLLLGPGLLVSELLAGAYLIARGQGGALLRVAWYFLRPATWRFIGRRRAAVQALRRRGDAEIVGRFAWRLEAPGVPGPALAAVNLLAGLYWAVARRLIVW